MDEIVGPQAVPAELKQPLIELLLGLADDECILGYWDSEWTGVASMLEEDVAMSSIAQDEIGHARLLYQQVSALTGTLIDQLVVVPVWITPQSERSTVNDFKLNRAKIPQS